MTTRRALFITTAVTALGCLRKTPNQVPAVAPHAVLDSTSRIDSATHQSSLLQLFHTGNARYDYRTTSIVRITMGDTTPRVDTTSVSALMSATFRPIGTNNLTIQAIITADSVAIRTGSSASVQLPAHVDTIRINAATGKHALSSQPTTSCNVQTQEAMIRVDDLVPVVFPTGKTTWTDTLLWQVCRAGIQLQAHRVTAYQFDSTAAEIRLLRRSVTTFSGRGIQWNQPVESTGQSVSTDTLLLDLTSRQRIQEIRGVTQLQVSFQSYLRNQQFDQSTQLLIQLR